MSGLGGSSDPFSPFSLPPELGGGGGRLINPGKGLPEELKEDVGTVLNPEDIVFTDPDGDNSALPELEELLSAPQQSGPWRKSHDLALRESRASHKPVLMWFTDSQNSAPCKALNEELFSQQEFDSWASENFVRLQVDRNISGSKLENESARKAEWVESLKKRYKVLGQPTLLVLTPNGEVTGRYKGYQRGKADFKWGQIRQGHRLAQDSHEKWRQAREKDGYRTWTGHRGRQVFAKLRYYRDGRLLLVEPDGTCFQTRLDRLSSSDKSWVLEQKRLSEQRQAAR